MLKSLLGVLTVCVGATLLPSAVSACEGGKVLLEDKFEKLNPAWGFSLYAETEKLTPEGYSVDFPPNNVRRGISQLSYYDDHVVCATFKVDYTCTDPNNCETAPYVGLVIWGTDTQNYYTFEVSPPYATYSVARLQRNKWLTPVAWTNLPDGKKFTSGEKFEISAVIKGGHATFKLNDKTVIEFDGMAPEGGSLAGFEVATSSSDKKNSQMTLTKLEVRELAP